MSNISDEVRKVADEYDVLPLYKLADRIDNEMVELPRDADEKPIQPGETVYIPDGDTGFEVVSLIYYSKTLVTVGICGDDLKQCRMPSILTHKRPDSWERIAGGLDDFADANYASGLLKQGIKDFADRIRKLAAREGGC